jgi:hypothetical protein
MFGLTPVVVAAGLAVADGRRDPDAVGVSDLMDRAFAKADGRVATLYRLIGRWLLELLAGGAPHAQLLPPGATAARVARRFCDRVCARAVRGEPELCAWLIAVRVPRPHLAVEDIEISLDVRSSAARDRAPAARPPATPVPFPHALAPSVAPAARLSRDPSVPCGVAGGDSPVRPPPPSPGATAAAEPDSPAGSHAVDRFGRAVDRFWSQRGWVGRRRVVPGRPRVLGAVGRQRTRGGRTVGAGVAR